MCQGHFHIFQDRPLSLRWKQIIAFKNNQVTCIYYESYTDPFSHWFFIGGFERKVKFFYKKYYGCQKIVFSGHIFTNIFYPHFMFEKLPSASWGKEVGPRLKLMTNKKYFSRHTKSEIHKMIITRDTPRTVLYGKSV